MSANRVLILGVLIRRNEPMHGYDIRRELEIWNADYWANIAYGSIYFALSKMTEEGFLEKAGEEQDGNRPAKILYQITERGRSEFEQLLRKMWWDLSPAVDPFVTALSFMDKMPKDEVIGALEYRIKQAQAFLASYDWFVKSKMDYPLTPRHLTYLFDLHLRRSQAEIAWMQELIEKLRRGEAP